MMEKIRKIIKKHADKVRFGIVGVVNTLIDVGTLTVLTQLLDMSRITGNYISTTLALCFSFFANKQYTFKDSSKNSFKQMVSFLIVTLFGLWVLQPITLKLVGMVTQNISLNPIIDLYIGKAIATVISLIWNYIMYKRVVFTTTEEQVEENTN